MILNNGSYLKAAAGMRNSYEFDYYRLDKDVHYKDSKYLCLLIATKDIRVRTADGDKIIKKGTTGGWVTKQSKLQVDEEGKYYSWVEEGCICYSAHLVGTYVCNDSSLLGNCIIIDTIIQNAKIKDNCCINNCFISGGIEIAAMYERLKEDSFYRPTQKVINDTEAVVADVVRDGILNKCGLFIADTVLDCTGYIIAQGTIEDCKIEGFVDIGGGIKLLSCNVNAELCNLDSVFLSTSQVEGVFNCNSSYIIGTSYFAEQTTIMHSDFIIPDGKKLEVIGSYIKRIEDIEVWGSVKGAYIRTEQVLKYYLKTNINK